MVKRFASFVIGLGCVGMYFAWRHVPDTPVVGLALSTLAMYGSLAVVAAGFVMGMVFGDEEMLRAEIENGKSHAANRHVEVDVNNPELVDRGWDPISAVSINQGDDWWDRSPLNPNPASLGYLISHSSLNE